MAIEYKGDLSPEGEVVPFRFQARDGVDPEAIQKLSETLGLQEVDNGNDAQGILFRSKTKLLTPDALGQFPDLMAAIRIGVGVDNVNMDVAAQLGIHIDATPGPSSIPVAVRALTLALSAAAKVSQSTALLQDGKWEKGQDSVAPLSVHKSTLGIIGYGRIGSEVAKMGNGIFAKTQFSDARDIEGKVESNEMLTQTSQFIVIAVDSPRKFEILDREAIMALNPGTVIINISRPWWVNQEALIERMNDPDPKNRIYYATDVYGTEGKNMFEKDPTIKELVSSDNFIGTMHTGAQDAGTKKDLGMNGVEKLLAYVQHGIMNPDSDPRMSFNKAFNVGKEKKLAGARFVVTHDSTAQKATQILGQAESHNINSIQNEEGRQYNGEKVAVTSFDIDNIGPDEAALVLKNIRENVEHFKARAMFYSDVS
ncbi:MAG: NAD(P)-dependent oxidoreductase [Candidatus Gracilibacteria bacterium]|nr:NAD(P)-dependent oxidoreductase [Candidatus Gracilibacteria bacterium]